MRSLLFGCCLAWLFCGCSVKSEPIKPGPAFSDSDVSKVGEWANARLDPLYSELVTGATEAELKAMADDVTATLIDDLRPFVGKRIAWDVPFYYANGRAVTIVEFDRTRNSMIPALIGVVGDLPAKDPDKFSQTVPIKLPLDKSKAEKYKEEAILSAVVDRVELTLIPGKFKGVIGFIIYVYLKDAELLPPKDNP